MCVCVRVCVFVCDSVRKCVCVCVCVCLSVKVAASVSVRSCLSVKVSLNASSPDERLVIWAWVFPGLGNPVAPEGDGGLGLIHP